ncbi:diphosphomevalonate/mevalonate 3,5-bisphosphate decarboxylase family protein [Moheibacter sediminis]|uniref:Diphosphomevalonate decarboxylase n=1 Tax=Moheibacter sediminis TaxID=1434700 RepID=A0A1W2CVF8_9FLAO|nr:diphosphomevalonate decarboxylase [Moheibacter sediminis]SMC88698.1 diphosphomevalonate decarboxylase [Moheibacter sediminis]
MEQFHSKLNKQKREGSGSVSAQCPSNIALVKYWGKRGNQIPMNSSLSFTLTNSYTETELKFKPKENDGYLVNVYLDKNLNEHFAPRIYTFFERIEEYIPFLQDFEFEIHTHNTFPHSSGIASSASGMGAMALCLVQMEQNFGGNLSEEEMLRKASFLARLGSGSACRSIYKGITVWGESEFVENSSDLYAVPYPYEIHTVFKVFQDTILLIDEGQKEVSSSVGHKLMENHPYAQQRFLAANENLGKLIPILKEGNLEEFGTLVEHEALSLHAMMLTSNPAYILIKPNTLNVIEKVWEFRRNTSANLFFTLDAGANVHLLYPENEREACLEFIQNALKTYCSKEKFIKDLTF